MHYICGQNSSRNTNNGINDSKTPFSALQEINTSPTISEHSYMRKSQYSQKATFESNIEKGRRSPWKTNFIKVEKSAFKNASKAKSQNPSKPVSNIATPKKGRERSIQPQQSQARPSNAADKILNNNNISIFMKGPQPMNYNKIYQKLKARSTSANNLNNVISNSVSYGSFKVAKYEELPSTERKKRNIIDNVFNSLMNNNTGGLSHFRKDGYSKNAATLSTRPFEISGNNRYAKKPTTARPKSANFLNN
jgi:hypothetical protein